MIDSACYCTLLRRGTRTITRLYDEALAPSGLLITQFSLLRSITRLGVDPTIASVAEATGLDRSTLGRNLRVLQNAGHLTLEIGSDARSVAVRLTHTGQQAVDAALPHWRRAQRRIESRLGSSDNAPLRQLLESLRALEESLA